MCLKIFFPLNWNEVPSKMSLSARSSDRVGIGGLDTHFCSLADIAVEQDSPVRFTKQH